MKRIPPLKSVGGSANDPTVLPDQPLAAPAVEFLQAESESQRQPLESHGGGRAVN